MRIQRSFFLEKLFFSGFFLKSKSGPSFVGLARCLGLALPAVGDGGLAAPGRVALATDVRLLLVGHRRGRAVATVSHVAVRVVVGCELVEIKLQIGELREGKPRLKRILPGKNHVFFSRQKK